MFATQDDDPASSRYLEVGLDTNEALLNFRTVGLAGRVLAWCAPRPIARSCAHTRRRPNVLVVLTLTVGVTRLRFSLQHRVWVLGAL